MAGNEGGAPTAQTETTTTVERICQRCAMPFEPRPSTPNQPFCSRKCTKQHDAVNRPATSNTSMQLRRRNSLNSDTPNQKTGTPTQAATGQKRSQDSRSPDTSPINGSSHLSKKGRLLKSPTSSLISRSVKLDTLGKDELISKLETCMNCLGQFEKCALLKRVSDLESTIQQLNDERDQLQLNFAQLNVEKEQMMITFAKKVFELDSNQQIPDKPSYASAARGSVLVASFADGENNQLNL